MIKFLKRLLVFPLLFLMAFTVFMVCSISWLLFPSCDNDKIANMFDQMPEVLCDWCEK